MIDTDIPLIAYVYVGVTSLVLAYVTYNDETNRASGTNKSESSTPILPSFLTGAASTQSDGSSSDASSSKGSILPEFLTGPPGESDKASSTNDTGSILPSFMQTSQNSQPPVVRGGRKKTKSSHKKSNKSKSNKSKSNKSK